MADLDPKNRDLMIMRYRYNLEMAKVQIMARHIRIKELEEEIARNTEDIIAQEKVIKEMELNISQQEELIAKG